MKLGIFDSGLGGLVIAKAIRERLPDHDMVYLGDTLRLPYGSRSTEAIVGFTRRAMEFLFAEECSLIVIACNTASAAALRTLQQTWLPHHYPDRNIIGVIVPTLEVAIEKGFKNLGVIGTNYIIQSNVFADELQKLSPDINMTQQATPLLVPLIENGGLPWIDGVLERYLAPVRSAGSECLILGCTHYPYLKPQIKSVLGEGFPLLSQDDIIPEKLADYLERHPEYSDKITRGGRMEFCVTDLTETYVDAAHAIFGQELDVRKVET